MVVVGVGGSDLFFVHQAWISFLSCFFGFKGYCFFMLFFHLLFVRGGTPVKFSFYELRRREIKFTKLTLGINMKTFYSTGLI